ncbi:manganese efflux pump MntP family protein [Clostridium magnum]|uniref:Putative manganese efflux pump MntP n=1 Tax=Clostridium magnum DSM 2767 TaxID=1121326 RepID=A0A161WSK4_9CLOT|nr:manganese efflux pump [Clostridium magnum]KZL89768.1 putative manganese efflux pump MntP [Clostridium magnum DSM 2767]SHH66353.1 Putative Mn2+ efflux pump MntP [Clostridium magnum DSM 2767]
MSFYSLFLIAIALSLDAFGVALCIGLNRAVTRSNKVLCVTSFGFFQFLFSIIGAYAGFLFNTYIASVPKLIGGALITIVGVMMLKEGFESKDECPLIRPGMFIVLGISVSIDAMVIGFTALNNISSNLVILKNTIFIGIITLIMCTIAFMLAKYLKRISLVGKYADYIGGVILIIFGIKMMFF